MYPAKDCTTMVVAAHSGLCAANLTHLAREEEEDDEEEENEEEEDEEVEEDGPFMNYRRCTPQGVAR